MKNIYIRNCHKIHDLQSYFENLNKKNYSNSRFFIFYNEGLTKKQNWLEKNDLKNILLLSGYQIISENKKLIIARIKPTKIVDYSVSIIIPARNEEKNIPGITNIIPRFGTKQEIIFVEGGSNDNTWIKIKQEVSRKSYKNLTLKCFKQKGKGKANAVRLGLKKSKNDLIMIYDADRTVESKELVRFYNAIKYGHGEFINGSRLVYPMENDAMQFLNKIANKLFGILFSYVFGQKFKDTLCGTKAFLRKDYLKFKRFSDDPFGDFELIFGAIDHNLKVVEIPVHYKERVYGKTNIKRFKHGLILFKLLIKSLIRFKFLKNKKLYKRISS